MYERRWEEPTLSLNSNEVLSANTLVIGGYIVWSSEHDDGHPKLVFLQLSQKIYGEILCTIVIKLDTKIYWVRLQCVSHNWCASFQITYFIQQHVRNLREQDKQITQG